MSEKACDVEVGDVWKGKNDTAYITCVQEDMIYFHSVHDKVGAGFPWRMYSLGTHHFHDGFYEYNTLLRKHCWKNVEKGENKQN